jgi:hypothetical protein
MEELVAKAKTNVFLFRRRVPVWSIRLATVIHSGVRNHVCSPAVWEEACRL